VLGHTGVQVSSGDTCSGRSVVGHLTMVKHLR
jgi:hypothetical protein